MEGGEEEHADQQLGVEAGHGHGRGAGPAAAPALAGGLDRGRGRGRGSTRSTPIVVPKIAIGSKRIKTNDLKNYFTSLNASSSGSRRSTQESGNAASSTAAEAVQENEAVQNVVDDIIQTGIRAGVVDEHPHGTQPQEQQEHEDEGIGLITEFNPHVHVIADPALRKPIERFHPNIQSDVRRAYLLRGPTQPIGHNFPRKRVGSDWRSFHPKWFKDYDWLEYSMSKDAVFCFSSFDNFFNYVSLIVTSTSASCKRKDKLLAKHRETILEKLESGEIFKGRGQNQMTNLARPGDTRWGSHFITLLRIETMWDSVVKALSMIHEDERNPGRAGGLVRKMESFSFVLNMKLMLKVFRITNELSLLLQRKDQNIVQAMSLLVDVKARLIQLRNEGWEPLLEDTKSFCVAKSIPVPNMEDAIPRWGRSRLDGNLITQEHHYRVDTFFAALDAIIMEMDHRFNEVSSELLVSFACLDPRDSFSKFDVEKIARLTEIYYEDFSTADRDLIREQLQTFIIHVRRIDDFRFCHDLGSLAVTMVKTEAILSFPLVYHLIELALILPVATSSVERAFSAMHLIKTDLRNKMCDDWLNDLLLCYIEKGIFRELGIDKVKKRFQAIKNRRVKLPKISKPPRCS